MSTIIKPNTCRTCPFKHVVTVGDVSQITCRRLPPVPLPIANPEFNPRAHPGQPQAIPILGYQSTFPNVGEDWWCGEHPGLRKFTFGIVSPKDDLSTSPHQGQG